MTAPALLLCRQLRIQAGQRILIDALIARHAERPYTLDYIHDIFTNFVELHGDRHFADDLSIVGGLAKLCGSTASGASRIGVPPPLAISASPAGQWISTLLSTGPASSSAT